MKTYCLMGMILMSLSVYAHEAPQSAASGDGLSDTTIMGENTPGYSREKTLQETQRQQEQVRKHENDLMKKKTDKLKKDKSF